MFYTKIITNPKIIRYNKLKYNKHTLSIWELNCREMSVEVISELICLSSLTNNLVGLGLVAGLFMVLKVYLKFNILFLIIIFKITIFISFKIILCQITIESSVTCLRLTIKSLTFTSMWVHGAIKNQLNTNWMIGAINLNWRFNYESHNKYQGIQLASDYLNK